ncbi:MAG TPA: hypothetical protein VF690_03000 [Hymenobacter sp.]|jgi:hypothetical protein
MHNVQIDGRFRAVPATWNDLTRPLLLRLMPLLYGGSASQTELRLRVLQVLLQVNLLLMLAFTDAQLAQIIWLADFALAEVTLTAQLLPHVRLPWRRDWRRRRYWGPRANLRNLRFLEFIFADAYFVAWAKDPTQTKWLNLLVAVLYRPQRRPYRPRAVDYKGDRREDFNEVHLDARAARLAHLPLAVRLAIATWYRGCRFQLEQDFPLVFTPANEDAAAGARDGWAHVLREMSGATFGPIDQTEQQLVRVVLAKMEDDARRAEQLRRQHQQQNSQLD